MINKNTLLIFVDGMQFNESQRLDVVKNSLSSPVKPSIGFSNNIYPEMFCGKSPDDIGYFNEWAPNFDAKPSFINKLLRPFDLLRYFKYPNAIFRIIILKKLFNKFVGNIPFKYLHFFTASGAHNFASFKDDSLLEANNFEIVDAALAKKSRVRLNQRDLIVAKEFLNTDMSNKNLLLSFMELDNISHTCGMWSKEYEEHLAWLGETISTVSKQYLSNNPNGDVFLFSDHGMTPVTDGAKIDLESRFGPMSNDSYIYFLDSTFLRVWSRNENLLSDIEEFLSNLESGHIICEKEREKYGVTNRAFGNLIFRAEEGLMFQPNFFGIRMVKAMHGYDSELESQFAVFADLSGKQRDHASLPKSSKEIYNFFHKTLS
jgi:hypothetical protein